MAKYKEDDDEDEDDDDDEDDDTENSEIDDSLEDGVYRPWSTYLCACQENVMNCFCVPTLLPCVVIELLHYVFNKPWHHSIAWSLFATPIAPLFMIEARRRIRRAHNLQGNLAVDVVCTTLCLPLSACQVRDELHTLRRDHQWRLAYKPPPGEPKHSPYTLPFVEMYASFKEWRRRRKEQNQKDDESDESSDEEFQ